MAEGTAIGDMDWDRDGRMNAEERAAGTNAMLADAPPASRPAGVSADMDENMKEVREGAQNATDDFHKSMDEADSVPEMISAVGTYIKDLGGPIGDGADYAAEAASDAYDVSDAASDAYDSVTEFFSY